MDDVPFLVKNDVPVTTPGTTRNNEDVGSPRILVAAVTALHLDDEVRIRILHITWTFDRPFFFRSLVTLHGKLSKAGRVSIPVGIATFILQPSTSPRIECFTITTRGRRISQVQEKTPQPTQRIHSPSTGFCVS